MGRKEEFGYFRRQTKEIVLEMARKYKDKIKREREPIHIKTKLRGAFNKFADLF